ncbi:MAG TPA: DUF3617 domain-containing protein [Vicinamibacterales bacterium]
MRARNILLGVVLLVPAVSDAQVNLRPGQYEYTMDLDLGIPSEGTKAVLDAAGVKNQKRLQCLTADDVKGDLSKLFAEAEEQNCKTSNLKKTGSKITFTMTCEEDSIRIISNNEITFDTDSFTTVTTFTDPGGHVRTSKVSAKRVGECPK